MLRKNFSAAAFIQPSHFAGGIVLGNFKLEFKFKLKAVIVWQVGK